MDFFGNLNTRYQWIKLTKQVPDRKSGGTVVPVNWDLLCQYSLINLDAIKRHTNHYFSNNAMTNGVPAPNNMTIANLTPDTNNNHHAIFYNHVCNKALSVG
eukprot:15359655-Ditylum_brightwellii.AAC.2